MGHIIPAFLVGVRRINRRCHCFGVPCRWRLALARRTRATSSVFALDDDWSGTAAGESRDVGRGVHRGENIFQHWCQAVQSAHSRLDMRRGGCQERLHSKNEHRMQRGVGHNVHRFEHVLRFRGSDVGPVEDNDVSRLLNHGITIVPMFLQ